MRDLKLKGMRSLKWKKIENLLSLIRDHHQSSDDENLLSLKPPFSNIRDHHQSSGSQNLLSLTFVIIISLLVTLSLLMISPFCPPALHLLNFC